jgi:hypothetical protein
MNAQQAQTYNQIKNSYVTDPRYAAARAAMNDPGATPEEYQWAQQTCAHLERAAHRSAESARVGGGL